MKFINNYVAKIAFLSLLLVGMLAMSSLSAFATGNEGKPRAKTVAVAKNRMTPKTAKPRKHRKARKTIKKMTPSAKPAK